jgi:hypothetical protein
MPKMAAIDRINRGWKTSITTTVLQSIKQNMGNEASTMVSKRLSNRNKDSMASRTIGIPKYVNTPFEYKLKYDTMWLGFSTLEMIPVLDSMLATATPIWAYLALNCCAGGDVKVKLNTTNSSAVNIAAAKTMYRAISDLFELETM